MARKITEPKTPAQDLANQAPNKADAIRLLRDHLLSQRQEPEIAEIAAIYARTKWTTGDTNRDKNYISSILSQDRSREGQAPAKPGRRPRATRFSAEPAASELISLKHRGEEVMAMLQAEETVSFESFARAVELVDELAKEFGGFERMKKCLLYWRELIGPNISPDR